MVFGVLRKTLQTMWNLSFPGAEAGHRQSMHKEWLKQKAELKKEVDGSAHPM